MGEILAAEPGAGAGHEDESVDVGGGEESGHIDGGFFEGGDVSDAIGAAVVFERVV